MNALVHIILRLVRGQRRALLRGLLLSVTVLVMGVALLGLSGWFITAAATAGLVGIGILFNVFVPSALIRLLALGRTAARYGERLLTHDATLRALSGLRVQLLQGLLTRPQRELERLRANAFLNRVTADVDALDGALLRLVLPSLAGFVVIGLAALVLWVVVAPVVALVVGVGFLALPTVIFLIGQRLARRPARRVEAALQAARSRLIDLIAGRDDLTAYGQIGVVSGTVRAAFTRHAADRARLDRIERRSGVLLDLTGAALVAAALAIGVGLVQAGRIEAAHAAIGIFVALALGEAVAPVRRALPEIGKMTQAARRILPSLEPAGEAAEGAVTPGPLSLRSVTALRGSRRLFSPVSLSVGPGETVALTGRSGVGKSTLLLIAAGVLPAGEGAVTFGGHDVAGLGRDALGNSIALVPQRHALIAGTIAENLRLAAPDATEDALWQALEQVKLADVIRARGGLDSRLGFRGAGLSGGEARRLVLARAVLRKPVLLLADEPTEGLDDHTARAVMAGLRDALPDTAILMAAHRPAEIEAADRVIALS